ncbi:MAG: GNAT family N-acetyltransferase, partial [Waterburya sp.]
MNIEIIDKIEIFEALRGNWEDVYHRDPQAQFFISWIWISATIKDFNQYKIPWLILAAKSSSNTADYVGFFPLTIETNDNESGGFYHNQLSLMGVTDAEHPGCLCLPEYEAEAVSSFAQYLQQQDSWSVLEMLNIPQANKRLSLLFSNFDSESFNTKEQSPDNYKNPLDSINNQIVPYLTLPESWELYLQDTLSSNTRQKIRRFLRKIENSAEFRITKVNGENLERHIEIITGFWRASWESRKGVKECNWLLRRMTFELRHCFEHDCLHLPVLWQQDKPLATIANLIDFNKKTILFMVGGRDETFKKFPSGFVLHAHAIRDAIQNGFKTYDFLMGNEAYKYSFGAKERYIQTITVERHNWKEQKRKLDVKTLPALLEMSQKCHRGNDLAKAETGYRQILEVQPEHPLALYGLSAIAQRQGKEQDAEDLLNHLLQIQPSNIKAWFGLGTLHQSHNRLSQAEEAYQQALSYQPAPAIAVAIYHNLGYALQQQGRLDEAIACYQKARELQPDSIEAEVMWANALHVQGQLSPEQQIRYAAVNNDLGNKRRQANDFQVAIEYYQQAIALNPNLVEAHYHLGRLLQKKANNWKQALACYQTVLKLQPDFILADIAIANLLYAQGKLSPEQQLKYAVLNNNVGSQYFQAGDSPTAIEFHRQAILLNSKLPEAYYGLGLSLHGQSENNLEESISCYQKALVLKPDFELAHVALAGAFHTQGRLSPEQRVEYATVSYELGSKYMQTGNFKVAIQYYELAVSLNPE